MHLKRTAGQPPVVAIVGRANVGKSTLWNKLGETTRAITAGKPHTTRDRNYTPCLWRGKMIDLVDTGGMDTTDEDAIQIGIRTQAEHAIKDADLVLFLVDVKTGILPQDVELAERVKRLNGKTMLIANKADKSAELGSAVAEELWKLNLGEPLAISAVSGRGVGDLLDVVHDRLNATNTPPSAPYTEESLKIVIMGRPNVGKSSLTNAILGHERSIVSPIPHTTREPIDTDFMWQGKRITLVDTAGMRKRARVTKGIEQQAIDRNRDALKRADVAVLVVDAAEDPRKQDKHLAGLLKEAQKGLIIVVNKWDLIQDKDSNTIKTFEANVRDALPFLAWAPIIFTSALNSQRVRDILHAAFKIQEERKRIITDNALDKFLKQVITKQSPKAATGTKAPYIASVVQTHTDPPRFLMTLRGVQVKLQTAWLRYFENQLRAKFGFEGTPIIVHTAFDKTPVAAPKGKQRRKKPIGRKGFRY